MTSLQHHYDKIAAESVP